MTALPAMNTSVRPTTADVVMLFIALLQGTGVSASLLGDFLALAAADGVVTALWLALYGWAALRLFYYDGASWLFWLLRYRLLLVLLVAGVVVSVSWSIDPMLSLRRVIHFAGTALLAFYIGYIFPIRQLLLLTASGLGLLLLASVMVALLLPDLGIQRYEGKLVWKGLFFDKNSLGFSAATTMLLSVTLAWNVTGMTQRLIFLLLAGVAAVALLGSQSATSLVAVSVGLGVMLFLFGVARAGLSRTAAVVLLSIAAVLAILTLNGVDISILFSALGRSSDLTGRQEVWEAVGYLIAQRPWTGTGYGTIWFPTAESEWQQQMLNLTWVAHHAHNGFFQTASQLGLPATALAVFFLLQLQIEAVAIYLYVPRWLPSLAIVGFEVAFLIANVTEAYFMVDRSLFWLLQISLPISLLRSVERAGEEEAGAVVAEWLGNDAVASADLAPRTN